MDDELEVCASSYNRYCNKRIDYQRACLSGRKRDVFDLIPFLLHEDHGKLIGNMQGKVPAGIAHFSCPSELKNLVLRYFPMFQSFDTVKPNCSIQFLALIGSAGTIVFSSQSDLDYWVGVDMQELESAALERLSQKLGVIENWARQTAGLEVHFFIMDPGRIRDNDFGAMTRESCGSALGSLLKDEFYRTGLLLAGRFPLFWITREGCDDEGYNSMVRDLIPDNRDTNNRFIDLGNVKTIVPSEYYGAALWQILKGLGSPLKSVLKMALIDLYSHASGYAPPLCRQLVSRIQSQIEGEQPDPYVFLAESLREFYTRQGLETVKRLVETCLLMRGFMGLTVETMDSVRMKRLHAIGRRWQWNEAELSGMHDLHEWETVRRETFNRQVLEFMIGAYRRIRARTRDIAANITERDLTIVGKKLKSFLEACPGKIAREMLFVTSSDIDRIEFMDQRLPGMRRSWQVNLTIRHGDDRPRHMARQFHHLLSAGAWCCLNGLFDVRQTICCSGHPVLNDAQIKTILLAFDQFFCTDAIQGSSLEELLEQTRITRVFLMPNWDDPQWTQYIKSVYVLYQNSLGELYYENITGEGDYCVQWVLRELLTSRVGSAPLSRLQWKVYISTGKKSSTRRLSDLLSRSIEKHIALLTRHYQT